MLLVFGEGAGEILFLASHCGIVSAAGCCRLSSIVGLRIDGSAIAKAGSLCSHHHKGERSHSNGEE